MRKFCYVTLICIFAFLVSPLNCFADSDNMSIYFNGEKIDLTVDPIIDGEEILVPMDEIFKVLDIKPVLNEDGRTIETDWCFTLNIGSGNVNAQGVELQMSNKVQLINDKIMIPIEFISDVLYESVILNSKEMEMYITTVGYDGALKREVKTESGLYVIDGTGEFEGSKILKGYPEENDFLVCFEGKPGSFSVNNRDIRGIDLDQVISWNYNGREVKSKLSDLYDFFYYGRSNNSYFEIYDESELSHDWFIETFGQTYLNWWEWQVFSSEASRLVERYFEESGQIKVKNRFEEANAAFDAMSWVSIDELEKLGFKFYNVFEASSRYTDEVRIFSGMRIRNIYGCVEFNEADLRAKKIIE